MNPGLVVKLRPAGPWRIGPDSGARNRVDVIYHSDSLYSAVTGAMSRMGSLDGVAGRHGAQSDARGVFQFVLSVPGRHRFCGAAAHHLAAHLAGGDVGARALEERALRSADDGGSDAGRQAAERESLERGRRQRVPGAGGQAGSVPHQRALERGGGPAERRERAARHGVHRISRGLRVVDGGIVSPTKRRASAGRSR